MKFLLVAQILILSMTVVSPCVRTAPGEEEPCKFLPLLLTKLCLACILRLLSYCLMPLYLNFMFDAVQRRKKLFNKIILRHLSLVFYEETLKF